MMTSARRWGAAALLPALLFCCTLVLGGRASAQSGVAEIEGYVFNDLNPDDELGPGDLPLSGVTITLRDNGGVPLLSTGTGPDGHFVFSGLPDGVYLVTENDPPGFGSVDATPGSAGTDVDLNTVRINVGG